MERHEQVHRAWHHIFVNNFIGGIGWAFGATVGFAAVIALLTILLHLINPVPIIGTFAVQISDFVAQHNTKLVK